MNPSLPLAALLSLSAVAAADPSPYGDEHPEQTRWRRQNPVSLLLLSPEERYRDPLAGPRKRILERVPQHYIVNYLGITPVSLSRIRNRVFRR